MATEKNRLKRRILLVDDHPLLRQGISQLINQQPDLTVCGEAEDRAGALEQMANTKPALAVVDISLKDERGLDLIKDLKAQYPNLPVLVLSMHDESLYAERALRAGARGYIMKREASEKVLEAIRQVLTGAVYVSDKITGRILDQVSGRVEKAKSSALDLLTDRELEIMMLIGKGYGSQQISNQLHISVKTVEAHRANIKEKLNLPSSAELLQNAIRWAQQMGDI